MYWGHSLLVAGWISNTLYSIRNLFVNLFYLIWRLLAWIVGGVESIFRNLAGIGSTNTDMVDQIINNPSVGLIFQNLLGFATALIVFFTIVKIIQDHYKEKDGGNPYKTVFKTFKGLLMFFFVQAAVTVGLYASQVMFKALDAATGGGSASIAGQVFRVMAYDANRMRIGYAGSDDDEDDDEGALSYAKNKYWYRIASNGKNPRMKKDGKYVLVEMNDNGKATSPAALRQKYLESFPIYSYGVVDDDGVSITPLSKWLGTMVDSPTDYGDYLENSFQNNFDVTDGDYYAELDGDLSGVSGSAGYQDDILRGVDLAVQPSISLSWSPIDILNYGYSMIEADKLDHDVQVLAFGTGILIKMSTQFVRYNAPVVTQKSLEDTAKQFGITMSGGVALEGTEAAASFSLETFDMSMFENILGTILCNVAYTNIVKIFVEAMPKMPAQTNIGPLSISYMKLFAPFIMDIVKTIADSAMFNIMPKDEEGNPLADTFAIDGKINDKSVYGAWVNVNTQSKYLPLVIEMYKIDGNFTDLWSQLLDAKDDFLGFLESSGEETWDAAAGKQEVLANMAGEVQDQQGWQAYMAKINNYNDYVKSQLPTLGNKLYLYEELGKQNLTTDEQKNNWLSGQDYKNTVANLENEIQTSFYNMVSRYNDNIAGERMGDDLMADPRITMPVYLPIIEFKTSNQLAEKMTPAQIAAAFANTDSNNGKMKVNLAIDQTAGKAYRIVDWKNAYGSDYVSNMGQVADLYVDPSRLDDDVKKNKVVLANSMTDLQYMNLAASGTRDWERQGLNYFLNNNGGSTSNSNDNHPFKAQVGVWFLAEDSYWGNDGVYLRGSLVKDLNSYLDGGTTYAAKTGTPIMKTYTSSANSNALISQGRATTRAALAPASSNLADSALANEFKQNIITFRELNPSAGKKKDKKVIKDWVQLDDALALNGEATTKELYNMSADDIDNIMAGNSRSTRQYLCMTKKGKFTAADGLGKYVGPFTYADAGTVNALYEVAAINYAVGFIAIISAMGVYMNFAFGLIQRAVNMAVLYVMSPITISFYPFDDGQKFSSKFVTPFYQEAISAFSIIVSLNLFIVLLEPVQEAVKTATGSATLGWLGLIAFVSMLPKLRDQITGILGGSSISAKSFGEAWKDAKKVSGIDGIKNAAKKAAHGIDAVRAARDRQIATRQDRQQQRLERLQARQKDGKLGFLGRHNLEKLKNKVDGGAAQQDRIDKARAANKDKDLSKMSAKELAAQTGLSKTDARRMKRQEAAALKEAGKLKKDANETAAQYQARVNAKRDQLLSDSNFKKSVNGVVSDKVHNAKANLAKARKAVGNTGLAFGLKSMGHAYKDSIFGAFHENKYGPNGRLVNDKDSLRGSLKRMKNAQIRTAAQKEIAAKERAYQSAVKSYKEPLIAGLSVAADRQAKADEEWAGRAKQKVALQELKKADTGSKLTDLIAAQMVQKGEATPEEAMAAAQQKVSAMNLAEQAKEYAKLGGDRKLAAGLAGGLVEFAGAKNKIDWANKAEELHATEQELRVNGKKLGSAKEIKVELAATEGKQNEFIQGIATAMAQALGKNDSADVKNIAKILSNADESTTFTDITKQVAGKLGISDVDQVGKSLETRYTDFVSGNLGYSSEIADLRTMIAAQNHLDKGEEMFRSKLGVDVSNADKAALMEVFRNVNDSNLYSTNENSLGYQKNKIIEKYADVGGLDNIECRKEVSDMEHRMKADLDVEMQRFEAKYASAIREHDIAQKYKQEMQAVDTMAIMTEIQHQREFHINMNMDVPSIQAVVNDSLIQKLHNDGDYAGAGMKLQQLVDAIKRHDNDAVTKLGFDDETIEKMKSWESQGLTKRLDGIAGLGAFDASHMGSTLVNMGGTSMEGMETALARLTSVAERKMIIEKFNVAAGAYAQQEAQARNIVKQVSNSIATTFTGKEFEDLYKEIAGMNKKAAGNAQEFADTLRATLDSVNEGRANINDEWIQKNLTALRDFRSKKIEEPGGMAIANTIDYFINGITQATVANDSMNMTNSVKNDISWMNSEINEILLKIKDWQGGK